MTRAERDKLILDARPIVARYIMVYANRYPLHVREDAIADGLAILPRAAETYNADHPNGMSFPNYAIRRAIGAMIDGLRSQDHLSRVERRAHNRRSDEAAADGHEPPGDGAPISLDFVLDRGRFGINSGTQIHDTIADPAASPEALLLDQARDDILHEAISHLPERERFIIQLSYFDHLTLAEIGIALGITQSRVSQLRAKALQRMRPSLTRQGLAEAA